ncbi:hypothetical protein F4860DRAFT_523894 [Xylaria cubensis]|nr:hypothetical protein F4860DRAFT_523894 [Xylaria cubensis]
MLEPNAIIGIVGSSVGLIVTLIGLAGRSVGVHRSRKHLKQVQKQKEILENKLTKAEKEIRSLSGISAQGVRHLTSETQRLIRHSRCQIEKFQRFSKKFNESRKFRGWNYIAISAGSDVISKYAKRFETYSDWITIARLSISLTLISERAWLGGAGVSSSSWRDIDRLRDELYRVKRAEEAHPGRLDKLYVNKGVNLERIERYAEGLVSRFAGTASSIVIDDLPEEPAQYHSASGIRERYHEHSRATQMHSPTDLSSWTQVYDTPSTPLRTYTLATSFRPETGSSRDHRRSTQNRSRSKTAFMRSKSSDSRHSLISTPDSGHDGDNEWNTGPESQRERRPREKHRHSVSSDREATMASNFRRSESVESNRHHRHRRQSGSRSNETHIRPRLYKSYHSDQGSDQEIRGRDTYKHNFKDTRQNPSPPLRYQLQSRSRHSSCHSDATQGQQRRESVVNIENYPSTERYHSTSSKATMSPRPSQDSGYVSRDTYRYSSGTSNASTRQRSSSRPNPRQQSQYDGGDRSRPPIALDRTEKKIRRAKTRIENTRRGAQ